MSTVSYFALLEIFRDFVQLVSITVVSLGIHIDLPMKFSFASISDWLSINFVLTVNVSVPGVMAAQLVILILCTIYLVVLTVKEVKKKFQGQEAQAAVEQSKLQRWVSRIVIFIITTVFTPLIQTSLKVFAGTQERIEESDKKGMEFMSVISLILLVIVNPILFYYGIKNTIPKENRFDAVGGRLVDYRALYVTQLKKHHNPFKELYKDYSHNGAYFKLYMMAFKFIRMCLMVKLPTPYVSVGSFWALYCIDIIINHVFLYANFKILPYHDFQSNRSALLGIINGILVIILNMILLLVDNEGATNTNAQRIISILQLISSIVLFFGYFLKTCLGGSAYFTKLGKTITKRLSFTTLRQRGIYDIAIGLKDRYLNFVYFNADHYKKEEEIRINVWESFWNDLISKDRSLKSDKPVDQLAFVNPGNAPPYLRNFRGSVEERMEENTRIMQKIGREEYEKELKNYERPDYKQLIGDVFAYVPPVDAYLDGPVGAKGFGFCKVSYFPFPFTCQLAFDGQSEMKEIHGQENLQNFVNFMKSDNYMQMRNFRIQLRALNGKEVNHDYVLQITRQKIRQNDQGKVETYSVPAKVYYKLGTFAATSDVEAFAELSDRTKIDVGKGLTVSLTYKEGQGRDDEGQTFTHGKYVLTQGALGVNYLNPTEGRINNLLEENKSKWQPSIQKTYDKYTEYLRSTAENINKKDETLSYGFNINIITAPYDVFTDRNQISEILSKETNPIMKNLMQNQTEKFNNLFEKLTLFKNNCYRAYLYLFFLDLYSHNKDITVIKKNQEILDPTSKDCIIYKDDLTIQHWKGLFIERKLRTAKGNGFFDNKLMKKMQRMINKLNEKPDNFLNESDLISVDHNNNNKKQHEEAGKEKPKFQDLRIAPTQTQILIGDEEQNLQQPHKKLNSLSITAKQKSSLSNEMKNQSNQDIDVYRA